MNVTPLRHNCSINSDFSLATILSIFESMWAKHMMQLTGTLCISDLDILVLLDVGALYSQLAGLRVKVNSLHREGESRPHSGAANTSCCRLCLHFPVATGKEVWIEIRGIEFWQRPENHNNYQCLPIIQSQQSEVSWMQITCIAVVQH